MQPCPERMWDVIAWTQSTTDLTKGFVSLKELQLSLSGGPNRCARNVNICFGGWERVCGYLWDMQDAEVVCRKLGCGFPLTATDSFPSSNSYLYMSTAVNSEGTEGTMWECSYNYQYGVCHHGDAAVTCTGYFSCGGLLQALSGSIQSPGYPSSYPNNAHCVWRIRLRDPARRIELQFTDVELEGNSCSYDAIEVYDGGSPEAWRLGLVCRNDHRVFTSSGNQLTILFRTDGSVTSRGFHAFYSSFLDFNSTVAPTAFDWTTTLSSTSGRFGGLGMEGGRCLSDYVEIYDGPLHSSPLLGKICSGYYHSYTSTSNLLTVRFHSNSRFTYRGFQANYYSTPADDSTTLLCLPDYMHVVVSRYFLQSHGYSAWNLTLNDPFCTPNITSNYVVFDIPYTRCGTVREENNDVIMYSNIIRGSSSGTLITRNRNLLLHVNCKMLHNTWAKTMYIADDNFEVNETQYERYDVNLTFYDSSSFSRPVYDSPYHVSINQNLYLEASLHSSDPSLELFLDTCVASPTHQNFTTRSYAIIQNGCVKDPTYSSYYSPYRHKLRFKFNAFQFVRSNPEVYLQCELVVCRAFDYSSRCHQGCVQRYKREANSDEESVIVVAGPIQLWEPGSEIGNGYGYRYGSE
ncbi:deleted in malignant brain tumors 1 protein [Turdus rufiventris]|nr:deleted in malignant brain tumors 1 protein [Turdus rufiventris]